MLFKRSLFVAILAVGMVVSSVVHAQTIIQDVQVRGTQRVEPATVQSYMDLNVGDPITQETLDSALKSLFATGLFADVTLTQQGSTLLVDVLENPVINQIAFEGNSKIEDGALLAEIQLRPRQVFTRTRVQSDLSRLYQVYRRTGRFSVNIEPKVIKLDQNRVDLIFEIQEGGVTKVESIRFVGNKRYSDAQLRSEITTKQETWYNFLTTSDRYDPDRLSFDQELLRRFYLGRGYADFQILSAVAELSDEQDRFFITVTLEEGERYKVGDVAINSQISNFDASVLRPEINIETADWYNADRVQESVDALTNALGDLQYAFVNVRPDVQRNRDDYTVDLTFNIGESPRVFVERIDVNGNVRTLDRVVRREFEIVEGDPFNRSKLAQSEQNIRNLDFFETLEVDTKPGSAPDKTVVDVKVSEKSTGELSIGAGFSTQDGPLADFRIRERNFLGKGQDLSLSTVIAGERTEFDLRFTEPYFLGRDVSAGVDAFLITRDFQEESSFDQKRTGGGFRLGYPLSERWRQTLRLRAEENEITDVDSDASQFIQLQEGERTTVAFSQRTVYDGRDSRIFPTEGTMFWFDTEIAGLADAEYVSGRTGLSYYYPVTDKVIFNLLGEVGGIESYSDENVQINERFFLGGDNFRGFDEAGVGPRDTTTQDALGGQYFYRSTAELSFPIGLDEELGILGHAFTDAGSLFELDDTGPNVADESSIRVSAGVGLSWRSPFGPVRADVAVPIVDEDFDETEVFRFNFGTRF